MIDVARVGVSGVSSIFEKIGYAFREQSVEDYGIDAIVEERSNNGLTGKLIGVQIKSGESFFKEVKGNKVIFRGKMRHYEYWTHYSLPVIIVLYNPETELCIYEVFASDKVCRTEKGWKIEIDMKNYLKSAANDLKNINKTQTEYQIRLGTLAFSKSLMKLAQQEKLIVEVCEWINKSSGKGDFFIKTIDDKGNETELYSKTIIGFGIRPYDEVLPEVFPWADLELDTEYYEMYGDRDYIEYRRQFNSNIYPYCNSANEVDWYRFRPVINSVGKSFLILDDFLNNESMYNIEF